MEIWIIKVLNKFGYFGVLFLIALENIFPPIPSEVILTFGGFMTIKSKLTIIGVVFYSSIGSFIGASILYYIGYKLNIKVLKRIIKSKIGKLLFLKERDIEKANSWFNQKGNKTVFFCRFIPIIRSLISIPAGMNKMSFLKFSTYTLLGTIMWNTVLVVLGSLLGKNYKIIINIIETYSYFTLMIIFLFLVIFIVKKYKKS